ncbi:MAG: 2,3-bisphosphoglycerate-independent phosphoglycerate mutase [Pseudomonadota bacterium]
MKPVVLCILDGWGISEHETGNAPRLARTPVMDKLMATCPNATLLTHGPHAGLPEGQMGNSEVGHTNIGAGRVVKMDLVQINDAISDGSFAQRPALAEFIATLTASGGQAHVMGLVSDGGVHGQFEHLTEAIDILCQAGIRVAIHAICDGRDVAPKSAGMFLERLETALPETAKIVSLIGRYYAMDRDNRWERVSQAYNVMVHGQASHQAASAASALQAAYGRGETDEFVLPTRIGDFAGMASMDGIFMLNYRADRAREILAAIADPTFDAFDIPGRPHLAARLGMVNYSTAHDDYMSAVFPKQKIANTLGSWVAQHGLRQFRLAETEKYPHVTFFLNGGVEPPETGEDRYMPKSPNVATYDLQPEMSAPEVTERLVGAIGADYDLIIVNYANPDMVGHTGDLDAAIKACEAVDQGLGAALAALDQVGGTMIVTADHGNCDVMINRETGGPHTAHTLNPVPVILAGGPAGATMRDGRLSDLAPTILQLMGLTQPPEMTGESLLS